MLNLLVRFVNLIIDNLSLLLSSIIQLLPDSPFMSVNFTNIQPYLNNLNWLIPMGEVITFMSLWAAGVLIYYCYTIVLRVTQTID